MFSLILLASSLLFSRVSGQSESIPSSFILDDADPPFTYAAAQGGSWTAYTAQSYKTQSNCTTQCYSIDPSAPYAQTWHEGLGSASATISFYGIGIDIYFIVRNMPNATTDVTFSIDGSTKGNFTHTGTSQTEPYWYDHQVFSASSLEDTGHNLTIQGQGQTNDYIFDYVNITQNIPPSLGGNTTDSDPFDGSSGNAVNAPPLPHNTALIASAVLCPIVALLVVITLCALFRTKRQPRIAPRPDQEDPRMFVTEQYVLTPSYPSHIQPNNDFVATARPFNPEPSKADPFPPTSNLNSNDIPPPYPIDHNHTT